MKETGKNNYDRQAIEINRMRGIIQDEERRRRRALAIAQKEQNLTLVIYMKNLLYLFIGLKKKGQRMQRKRIKALT